MRKTTQFCYTISLIAMLAFSGTHSAAEPLNNSEVGVRYLNALYAFNYSELGNLLDTNAIFEDPTAVVMSPDMTWRFEGRDAILDFVRQTSASIVSAEYRVLSEFSTGEFVVFNMEYSTVFDGEMLGTPGQELSVELPAVTILRIQDGLVIRHTDYVDYDLMLAESTVLSRH
jgi:ketosteroid isomerase-like protein